MAKRVYLDTDFGLVFGYGVNTTVVSAQLVHIPGDPGDPGADPPIPPTPDVDYVKVYPASLAGIAFSTVLDVEGAGQVDVTGVANDLGGDFFTYSTPLIAPAAAAYLRTPWLWIGNTLFTRGSGNSVQLSYSESVTHDLYVDTIVSTSSGKIHAYLDGVDKGVFDSYDPDPAGHPNSILLASNVAAGNHTIRIVAEGIAPGTSFIFVYFNSFSLFQHITETGGAYSYAGADGSLEQSSNNFVGAWQIVAGSPSFAYTVTGGDSVFFYPQLTAGGRVTVRTRKDFASAIVEVYVNGVLKTTLDMYADPPALPEITILETAAGDAPGLYNVELRHTGAANAAASGPPYFFYLESVVVYFNMTDSDALQLVAEFLVQMEAANGSDGAMPDALYASYYNFEAQTTYAMFGLLAAYQVRGDARYLDVVKRHLLWLVQVQISDAAPFHDGSWEGAYQKDGPGAYSNGIPLTVNQIYGISKYRWADTSHTLPAFLLWWYHRISGDDATLAACLPAFRKALDGCIDNVYDGESGLTFAAWQYHDAPTIFLYHDAVKRYSGDGTLLETHNDDDLDFFSYQNPVYWSSFSADDALNGDAHYTLKSGSYAQFSLALNAGDVVKWTVITAFNVGIAEIYVSTDGVTYTLSTTIDCYSANIVPGVEFTIYTAPGSNTYYFRIQHSGTINAAGLTALGWSKYPVRLTADNCDTITGFAAMWFLTRATKYAHMAAIAHARLFANCWDATHSRWSVGLSGSPPVADTLSFYDFVQPYVPWSTVWSRWSQPAAYLAQGLAAMEPYQDSEGGFLLPGLSEAIYSDSANYLIGENQLAAPTDAGKYALAKQFVKSGLYLLNLNGVPVAGALFSKRFPYLYTVYAGMTCLALAGAKNPFIEQLQFSESKVVVRR